MPSLVSFLRSNKEGMLFFEYYGVPWEIVVVVAKVAANGVCLADLLEGHLVGGVCDGDDVLVVQAGGVRDGLLFFDLVETKVRLWAERLVAPLVLHFKGSILALEDIVLIRNEPVELGSWFDFLWKW